MADTVSKSWFITFNNPEEHGYTGTPEEICERIVSEWASRSDTAVCACTYCIAANGLKHCHVVAEDVKPMRFSAIKKSFLIGCHLEPTKGSKRQAEDYIYKRGVFAEKGEEILYMSSNGDIKGNQGARTDLEGYYKRIQAGESLKSIFADTPKAYAHKNVLLSMYNDIHSANVPDVKNMKVIWHVGKSGTGKSYERILLNTLYGKENIYHVTDYSHPFDKYACEPVLFIDELRHQIPFTQLLTILDVYKSDIGARYQNTEALWNEVHITSVLTPQQCYSSGCDSFDSIEQLLRRISQICYHYRDKNGSYCKAYFEPHTNLIDMENHVNALIQNSDMVPLWLQEYEDIGSGAGDAPEGAPLAHGATL